MSYAGPGVRSQYRDALENTLALALGSIYLLPILLGAATVAIQSLHLAPEKTDIKPFFRSVNLVFSSNIWLAGVEGAAFFVFLASMFIYSFYRPEGLGIPGSHIWVYKGTSAKVRDATKKEIYEHTHGSGSWVTKIATIRRFILFASVLLTCVLPSTLLTRTGTDSLQAVVAVALSGFVFLAAGLTLFVAGRAFTSETLQLGGADKFLLAEVAVLFLLMPVCALYLLLFYFRHSLWSLWTATMYVLVQWVFLLALGAMLFLNLTTWMVAKLAKSK